MTITAESRIGGTASPSTDELVNRGRSIVDYFKRSMSTSQILRLVIKFKKRSPHGDGQLYFLFICGEIEVSDQQKQRARERAHCDPEWAKIIGYSDRVGEAATHNVDHPNEVPRDGLER